MKRWLQRLSCACLLLMLAFSSVPVVSATEMETPDWFRKEPALKQLSDLATGKAPPYSINGNRDCVQRKILTRPVRVMNVWPYFSSEQSHESCVVDSAFGSISQSGYLQLPGENTFGRILLPWGSSALIMPIPRSANAIYLEPNLPDGMHPILLHDVIKHIDGLALPTGEIEYTLRDSTPITELVGSDGQKLVIDTESVSFSQTGRWMVADIPYLGISRINTWSFNIKIFDPAYFNHDVGSGPLPKTAVSANGRFVVVSSNGFTRARLYDLDVCSSSSACRYIDLWQYFKNKVPGFIGVSNWRFSTEHKLKFYLVHQPPDGGRTITRSMLFADGEKLSGYGYIALGDSFASGEGAHSYKGLTDTTDNKCHLSLLSYPYLIAHDLMMNEAESVACSGAVINDIYDSEEKYPDGSQAKGKENEEEDISILEGFLPGYRQQSEFIMHYQPDVVTISAIGNDIGFADKIKACVMPGTCYNDYESRLEAALEVNAQFDRLSGMYAEIKKEMENKKVYVIGYPEIAMDGGNCPGNVKLDAEEVRFSNQLVRHLNKMIHSAADKAGFFYVDVEKAFYGHRLCETDYPNVAINGLTAGDDTRLFGIELGGPIGNESFHPNDMGHRKLKAAILDKTKDLAEPMPEPNPKAAPPAISNDMELLKDMPKSGRNIKTVTYISDMLDRQAAQRNEALNGTIDFSSSGLRPNSEVQVWMHSVPVKLGDFAVDAFGKLSFSAVIPEGAPYGFHTIHVYGTSVSGKPLDIQQVFYVAAASQQQIPEKTEPIPGNSDPKPPENNPETVAGNEEMLLGDTEIFADTTREYAYGPYQAPVENSGTASDTGVAGAVTTADPVPEITEVENSEKSAIWPVFGGLVFTVAVVMLVSSGVKKIS